MTLLQAKIDNHWRDAHAGFTLVEVCVAIAVCVLFGLAAFATNERLLIALKAQKETTAASMMLQERMESFRTAAYSDIANSSYVNTNIVAKPTTSEAPLGNLSETITVKGDLLASGGTPSSHVNQWLRNAQYPTGNSTDTNNTLVANYDLLQVDILLTWTTANGRGRTRDLTAIFGRGNVGP
jgi:type II secretory pathway pseudopilin PulG